eukprot:scaffold31494_cov49-Prasinocladus_malaysianus.AAC.3
MACSHQSAGWPQSMSLEEAIERPALIQQVAVLSAQTCVTMLGGLRKARLPASQIQVVRLIPQHWGMLADIKHSPARLRDERTCECCHTTRRPRPRHRASALHPSSALTPETVAPMTCTPIEACPNRAA